jgi:hypothetical protein
MLCGLTAASLLLPACATITRGTSQKFTIETSPSEADIKLSTGQTCVSPCTLNLKRKSQFVVTASKEGYKTQETEVHGKVSGGGAAGFAGNAIFGGLIGAGVDAASGAAMSLEPNPLKLTLVPVDQAPVVTATATPEEVPAVPAPVEMVAIPAPADASASETPAAEPAPAAEAPTAEASPTDGQ